MAPLADRLAAGPYRAGVVAQAQPDRRRRSRRAGRRAAANPTVRTLDLTNTGLTGDGLRALTDALHAPAGAARAALPRRQQPRPGRGAAAGRLLREAGVRELYLAAGRLGDDGATVLADAVTDRGPAGGAGLGGNGIGPAGVRRWRPASTRLSALDLARPPSVVALRAEPNEVGDEGAAGARRARCPAAACAGSTCATPGSPAAAPDAAR